MKERKGLMYEGTWGGPEIRETVVGGEKHMWREDRGMEERENPFIYTFSTSELIQLLK